MTTSGEGNDMDYSKARANYNMSFNNGFFNREMYINIDMIKKKKKFLQ